MAEVGLTAHVLRRTTFGPFPDQVRSAAAECADLGDLIDRQLSTVIPFEPRMTEADPWQWTDEPGPQQLVDHGPIEIYGPDPSGTAPFDMDIVRNWWVNRMLSPDAALHEKMMWIWHGILTTAGDKATRLNPLFQQLEVLHTHALGNFRDLLYEMQTSGAMLMYLDGNYSAIDGPPNENHARELLELFTLGLDNFDQSDVEAASRLLAGWQADSGAPDPPDNIVTFDRTRGPRDPERVVGVDGVRSARELVNVLLDHPACPSFVVGRLWDSIIGAPRDHALIAEWGDAFRASRFEIQPLLQAMLRSDAFRESVHARPRSPIEWYCASVRALGAALPIVAARDLFRLGQTPFLPPSVAGWPLGEAWSSPSQTAARIRQVARFEVLAGPELAEAPDLVSASLDRCSVSEAGPDTVAALRQLDAELQSAGTPAEVRSVALLSATVLSPDFSRS